MALRLGYMAIHASRHVVPLRVLANLVRKAAFIARARGHHAARSPSEIGRLVHGIERAIEFSDCYPRALITAYLCLASGRECVLTAGTLAPTRKMHAWCSMDGLLPYEPLPEHYLYQPVWLMALAP